ncbi:MAG: sigma-70 family RNA polymerase sigma factor [Deltaproteobacteria bacterium]|nr:sigma-70 family RNA polymerase sigma factor [Deltaproteobacteria bacterium]
MRYARGVRIVLDRHTRTATEAEDLFQETFALAVVKLRAGELRDLSKLGGFLSSLARNLATEHYRKVIRRKTDVDSETAEGSSSASGGGQLGEVLRSEEATLVRRTLQELSTERDREILFRFYIAEEDKETIAAAYDLDSLQFNRVLHRARQRYKALYLERLKAMEVSSAAVTLAAFLGLVTVLSALFRLSVTLRG